MRKPRPLETRFFYVNLIRDGNFWRINVYVKRTLYEKEAELLSRWLLKAAAWIREQEGK